MEMLSDSITFLFLLLRKGPKHDDERLQSNQDMIVVKTITGKIEVLSNCTDMDNNKITRIPNK